MPCLQCKPLAPSNHKKGGFTLDLVLGKALLVDRGYLSIKRSWILRFFVCAGGWVVGDNVKVSTDFFLESGVALVDA